MTPKILTLCLLLSSSFGNSAVSKDQPMIDSSKFATSAKISVSDNAPLEERNYQQVKESITSKNSVIVLLTCSMLL